MTDAVRYLIRKDDRHAWSLDELLEAIHRSGQSADFSSVFRAVATLERAGTIQRVELGDGRARYESVREHHEHIRCTSCGQVAEIPGCLVSEAAAGVQASTGYQVRTHHVVFSGICPMCQEAATPSIPT